MPFHRALQLLQSAGGMEASALAELYESDVVLLLARPPRAVVPFPCGVGRPMPLARVVESFREAAEALRAALAFDLTGAVTVSELALEAAVLRCADLGATLSDRLLSSVDDGPRGLALQETMLGYWKGGRRADDVGAELVISPSTVRYRVRRLAELSGVDLGDPVQCWQLWWALQHRRLVRLGHL
jgi:DNA-binding PucR family transcriptional regulator